MNKQLRLLALLALVTLGLAWNGPGKCGTKRSPDGSSTSDKSIPTCGKHECDDPTIRNQYLVGSDTAAVTVNLNVVYFGNLSGTAQSDYDAQMAFFKQEYKKFFKIDWNINTTVVPDRYTTVDSADTTTHASMAREFYIPNSFTLMWSVFSPNTDNLLGYAYSPQDLDLVNNPQGFYCILDIANALTPTGTTVLHEIGHMYGLFHPFIEDATPRCTSCVENMDDVDRDILGDFCNDTLPVPMSFKCDSLSADDCHNNTFTDLTGLPQNNYMAYTPDSCQNEFTAQQGARARCYLDKLLSNYVVGAPLSSAPVTAPVSNTPISATPIKTPATTKVVSAATHVVQVFSSIALIVLLAL